MKPEPLTRSKAWTAMVLLAGSLAMAPALAEGTLPPGSSVTPQGVPILSGGIGETDRTSMNDVSQAFNLRVITARPTGEYLAGVNLTIRNERGATLVATVTQGPLLFAQLPPGKYTVTAMSGSDVQTEKVTVAQSHQSVVLLHLGDA